MYAVSVIAASLTAIVAALNVDRLGAWLARQMEPWIIKHPRSSEWMVYRPARFIGRHPKVMVLPAVMFVVIVFGLAFMNSGTDVPQPRKSTASVVLPDD